MKRNIIHTLSMAVVLPILLASCQQEEWPDIPGKSDATPLTITVTDGGYASTDNVVTRAAENGYRTEFTAGDACGLYIVRNGETIYENVKLTAVSDSDGRLLWQPEVGANLSGGLASEKYFLYYPYQSDMDGNVDAIATDADGFFAPLVSGWQPATDQSLYSGYTASDLMTAQGTASKSSDGTLLLSFSMTHRMAMAVIEMPKTVYKFTDASIPDYTGATSADFTVSDIQPYAITPGTYRCIVNPASGTAINIVGSYAGGKKLFTIATSGHSGGIYITYTVDGLTPAEQQITLRMGDYFCKNGDNDWYIIPQEAAPDGNVIGIVFHAGQHWTDLTDYTSTGIGQQKCHGYVVALTDVHNGDEDLLRWEYGPNGESDRSPETSPNTADWQGYSNSLILHEFVNDETNKAEGWEMKHFPAALACETYGNRTTDQDGNPDDGKYDWQQPLAAPSNTSGWFLPSCGQLLHLNNNRSLFSARITDVKNNTPADCIYKDKINWFSEYGYWSSSEEYYKDYAWYVIFGGTMGYSRSKSYARHVRAVLAF